MTNRQTVGVKTLSWYNPLSIRGVTCALILEEGEAAQSTPVAAGVLAEHHKIELSLLIGLRLNNYDGSVRQLLKSNQENRQ